VARFDRWARVRRPAAPSGLQYATYEHRLIAELDHDRLPRHVAVLADGNRRWARTNAPGQPLVAGYQAGADMLKEFVEWVRRSGWVVAFVIPVGHKGSWVLATENNTFVVCFFFGWWVSPFSGAEGA
jgi:short-chain Z-isoprenyl diphosphate synthase